MYVVITLEVDSAGCSRDSVWQWVNNALDHGDVCRALTFDDAGAECPFTIVTSSHVVEGGEQDGTSAPRPGPAGSCEADGCLGWLVVNGEDGGRYGNGKIERCDACGERHGVMTNDDAVWLAVAVGFVVDGTGDISSVPACIDPDGGDSATWPQRATEARDADEPEHPKMTYVRETEPAPAEPPPVCPECGNDDLELLRFVETIESWRPVLRFVRDTTATTGGADRVEVAGLYTAGGEGYDEDGREPRWECHGRDAEGAECCHRWPVTPAQYAAIDFC